MRWMLCGNQETEELRDREENNGSRQEKGSTYQCHRLLARCPPQARQDREVLLNLRRCLGIERRTV